MPPKTVLITQLINPILHRLAMQFLQKPGLRVVCLGKGSLLNELTTNDGELQFRNCEDTAVDSIWHAWTGVHSLEESQTAMQQMLSLAGKQKTAVIHYVGMSDAASEKSGSGNGNGCEQTLARECQIWNERALEQSGCAFRIYRVPLFLEEDPSSQWARFVHAFYQFREEIEGRIPGYFTASPLRVHLPARGTVNLSHLKHIVAALEEISFATDPASRYQFFVQGDMRLEDCLPAVAEATGLHLEIISDEKQSNLIDKLFALRLKEYFPFLYLPSPPDSGSSGLASESLEADTASGPLSRKLTQCPQYIAVPQAAIQEVVSAVRGQVGRTTAAYDWESDFKKKQLALAEGETLHYYTGGQGEKTLVLINAYGQSFGYWEKLIRAVSGQMRIILWIPRGNNPQTIGQRLATVPKEHADDLERILANEEIESCTLAAWCSGPKLALEYYARYPRRVVSMIFIAPSFKGLLQHKSLETEYEKNLEPLLDTIQKFPENADVVLEYLKGILLAQNKQARSIEQLASLPEKELQEALTSVNVNLQELVLEPFCAANVVAYAKQMRYFWRHDFLQGLGEIRIPVVFAGGDCDRIASQAIAKAVAAMIPGARYLEIRGGTHYIHYEQWELLAQIIEGVVNSGGRLRGTPPWVNMIEAFKSEMLATNG